MRVESWAKPYHKCARQQKSCARLDIAPFGQPLRVSNKPRPPLSWMAQGVPWLIGCHLRKCLKSFNFDCGTLAAYLPTMNLRSIFSVLSLSLLAAACGGRIDSDLVGSSSGNGGSSGKLGSSGANCEAYPACDAGDTFIADVTCRGDAPCAAVACPAETTCYTREICGSMIACSATSKCLGDIACDPSDRQVRSASECPQDTSCYSRTYCGTTIWCTGETANCAAYPSCGADEQEVSGPNARICSAKDANCHPVTLCGATIWCATILPPRVDAGTGP
jgi:hypothetical protein